MIRYSPNDFPNDWGLYRLTGLKITGDSREFGEDVTPKREKVGRKEIYQPRRKKFANRVYTSHTRSLLIVKTVGTFILVGVLKSYVHISGNTAGVAVIVVIFTCLNIDDIV